MRWYHYTSLEIFDKILTDEALLSNYERIRKSVLDNPDILKRLERGLDSTRLEDPKEYRRNNNIFLTQYNNHGVGRCPEIALGFELNQKANSRDFLILPIVSLDSLVNIGTTQIHIPTVREILNTAHNGKYRRIPIYENNSCY